MKFSNEHIVPRALEVRRLVALGSGVGNWKKAQELEEDFQGPGHILFLDLSPGNIGTLTL